MVTKLFGATRPHVAVFGQKDAQQLAIVRQMVADLDLGVQIVAMPTVREHDGLAMSSRNRRLPPLDRTAAVCIWQGLEALRAAVRRGERNIDVLTAIAIGPIAEQPRATLEYLQLVDPQTLQPLTGVIADTSTDSGSSGRLLVVVAAWFGEVRLIDNVLLN